MPRRPPGQRVIPSLCGARPVFSASTRGKSPSARTPWCSSGTSHMRGSTPPTFAALVVFADEGGELVSRPDAYRIAPGVWVAYWPAFDTDEGAGLHRRRLLSAEASSPSLVSSLSACRSPRSRRSLGGLRVEAVREAREEMAGSGGRPPGGGNPGSTRGLVPLKPLHQPSYGSHPSAAATERCRAHSGGERPSTSPHAR